MGAFQAVIIDADNAQSLDRQLLLFGGVRTSKSTFLGMTGYLQISQLGEKLLDKIKDDFSFARVEIARIVIFDLRAFARKRHDFVDGRFLFCHPGFQMDEKEFVPNWVRAEGGAPRLKRRLDPGKAPGV